MRRQLSSRLLGGAMTTVVMMAAALWTAPLPAQGGAGHAAPAPANDPIDVAVTYGATRANTIESSNFWMQGGSVQLCGRFYRGLGVAAEVAGMHAGAIQSPGAGLDMVTATFGPRYTWSPARRRYEIFAQALGGAANGFHGVFPAAAGASDSAFSLAFQTGGGMNLRLSPRAALRVFEADWLRTGLPNSTNNAQNNLRLGAGVVFRFR